MQRTIENFALANNLSLFLNKERKDFTREDLIKIILEKNIERITFHYTGIDGKIKELKIPVTNRRQAELILSEGERVDGSSLFKGMVDTGKSDLYVIPVYKSAFLNPFSEGSLDFICRFVNASGELAPFAPDNILNNASALFKKNTGFDFHAFGELEFYLLKKFDENVYPLPRQKGYHASSPFAKSGDVLVEMLRHISQITENIKYAHHEVGCLQNLVSEFEEINGRSLEQVEIEFLPTPIDETADILVLSSWIIRNTAYKNGYIATFVPKIEIGHAGNGMHVHMAIMKDGDNAMIDSEGALSKQAKMLIGGLCHYAPSLTAFGNMTSSSYLRLVPHQEAPTKVCWSEMNRSAMIRVPLGWSKVGNLAKKINPQQTEELPAHCSRQTVEIRTPDGSTNAHLLLSGLTMAAEWGLTHEKESLEIAQNGYVSVNIHSSAQYSHLPELATSCTESSEILLQHRTDYERDGIFPPNVINYVANTLQNENDRNLNKRIMALPDEEKVIESRRLMHKNIHLF